MSSVELEPLTIVTCSERAKLQTNNTSHPARLDRIITDTCHLSFADWRPLYTAHVGRHRTRLDNPPCA